MLSIKDRLYKKEQRVWHKKRCSGINGRSVSSEADQLREKGAGSVKHKRSVVPKKEQEIWYKKSTHSGINGRSVPSEADQLLKKERQ